MTDNSENTPDVADLQPEPEQRSGNPDPPNQFEEGNKASLKHGLFQSYDGLMDSLSDDEKKLVGEMSKEFVWQYQEAHDEDPGTAEREMIRNLVLDTLKRKRANEFMFTEGEFVNFDEEQRHNVYSRIRRDNREEMEALGLLDTPEAEKQASEASWFEAMAEADETTDEEDK